MFHHTVMPQRHVGNIFTKAFYKTHFYFKHLITFIRTWKCDLLLPYWSKTLPQNHKHGEGKLICISSLQEALVHLLLTNKWKTTPFLQLLLSCKGICLCLIPVQLHDFCGSSLNNVKAVHRDSFQYIPEMFCFLCVPEVLWPEQKCRIWSETFWKKQKKRSTYILLVYRVFGNMNS